MVKKITAAIALDAMGGDGEPIAAVQGAIGASKRAIPVDLYGDSCQLEVQLDRCEPGWRDLPLRVIHSSELVLMSEEPVKAIRRKRDSSLLNAMRAVASGKAGAFVSAGNSGAIAVAAILVMHKMCGIERPALGAFLPCVNKKSVFCLDLGINVDCRSDHMLQFARMGCDVVRKRLGIKKPTVGLLCNGIEACKGSSLVKEANKLLCTSGMAFVGNVEPGDVLAGKVDVVVTDGFTGNIFLKSLEAVGKLFKSRGVQVDTLSKGCAQLLGVRGPVFIAHGSASGHDIEKAIEVASIAALNSDFALSEESVDGRHSRVF